jgi:hypothetical protein
LDTTRQFPSCLCSQRPATFEAKPEVSDERDGVGFITSARVFHMSILDIVSLLILAVLIVGALFLILVVAAIPGRLAKNRHSPWAEAINVGGWIGVLLPPIWMLALIAAFVRPRVGEGAQIAVSQDETTELAAAMAKISERITTLQNNIHALSSGATGSGAGGVRP